jgi:hypothetical protein
LNRHVDFWRLPGGRRFVEAIRTGDRERRSILIHEPFQTAPLVSAIADLTRREGLDQLCEVDGALHETLCERLKGTFGNVASTVDGFAFDLKYAVILVWNAEANASLTADILSFAQSCAVRGDTSAPVVLLVTPQHVDACSRPVWELVQAEGILGPHDGIGFAAAAGRGTQTFEHRLKTSVAVEVGAWDLDIVERILSMPAHRATRPDEYLTNWSDSRVDAWRGTRPSWASGNLDRWGGEPCIHPLLLAANEPPLLAKRVWRGQVAILFPWLDEYRQAVVRTYRRKLQPDELSYGDDVDTLDWGPICWQLKRAGISSRVLDAIHAGRMMRNDLAHGRPVGWAAIQSFESGMVGVGLSR